jgi:hypothetical protein
VNFNGEKKRMVAKKQRSNLMDYRNYYHNSFGAERFRSDLNNLEITAINKNK